MKHKILSKHEFLTEQSYKPCTPFLRCFYFKCPYYVGELIYCLLDCDYNNYLKYMYKELLDPYWKDIVDETNRRLNNE